jgi:hypothetical protein
MNKKKREEEACFKRINECHVLNNKALQAKDEKISPVPPIHHSLRGRGVSTCNPILLDSN